MKKADYYIIYGILLSIGLFLLLLTEEKVFAGIFLGIFISGIEKILGIEHEDVVKVSNTLQDGEIEFENLR